MLPHYKVSLSVVLVLIMCVFLFANQELQVSCSLVQWLVSSVLICGITCLSVLSSQIISFCYGYMVCRQSYITARSKCKVSKWENVQETVLAMYFKPFEYKKH